MCVCVFLFVCLCVCAYLCLGSTPAVQMYVSFSVTETKEDRQMCSTCLFLSRSCRVRDALRRLRSLRWPLSTSKLCRLRWRTASLSPMPPPKYSKVCSYLLVYFSLPAHNHLLIYRGFPTRMVYLYYKLCLRYSILVWNSGYSVTHSFSFVLDIGDSSHSSIVVVDLNNVVHVCSSFYSFFYAFLNY